MTIALALITESTANDKRHVFWKVCTNQWSVFLLHILADAKYYPVVRNFAY